MGRMLWIGGLAAALVLVACRKPEALRSGASLAAERFAEAVIRRDAATAKVLTHGESATTQVADFIYRLPDRIREVHASTFSVDVETPGGDGQTVTIRATHMLRVDPPGVHSRFGPAGAVARYVLEVTTVDGEWKITAFECDVKPE